MEKINLKKSIRELKITDILTYINVKNLFFVYIFMIFLIDSIRFSLKNPALLGTFSYYHALNSVAQLNLRKFDIYELLLRPNPEILSKVLPLIFSLVLLYFIYSYLENNLHHVNSKLYVFLLVLNPFFLFLGTVSNSLVFYAMLFFISLYLYKLKSKNLNILANFMVFIISFFSIPTAIFSVIVLSINKLRTGVIISASVGLVSFILRGVDIISLEISFNSFFNSLIFDLGSRYGMSIFSIALAIFGILYSYKNKIRLTLGILMLLLFSVLAFFVHFHFTFFAGLIIVYFASIGIEKIVDREWQSIFIKEIALIVIFAGLLFSALSFVNEISKSSPDKGIVDSLKYLEEIGIKDSLVLSHSSRGFWIEFYSGLKPFASDLSPLSAKRISSLIFESRDIDSTKELLRTYGINYVFIDKEMKSGLVWNYPDEGMLFLLQSNETFKRVYSNKNGDEIWEVTAAVKDN